jgi:hypothetical protein
MIWLSTSTRPILIHSWPERNLANQKRRKAKNRKFEQATEETSLSWFGSSVASCWFTELPKLSKQTRETRQTSDGKEPTQFP